MSRVDCNGCLAGGGLVLGAWGVSIRCSFLASNCVTFSRGYGGSYPKNPFVSKNPFRRLLNVHRDSIKCCKMASSDSPLT